ncbi:unnamed protein product [Urochloa humidicola]
MFFCILPRFRPLISTPSKTVVPRNHPVVAPPGEGTGEGKGSHPHMVGPIKLFLSPPSSNLSQSPLTLKKGRDEEGLPEKKWVRLCRGVGGRPSPASPRTPAAAGRKERRWRRKCWAGAGGGPEAGPAMGSEVVPAEGQRPRWRQISAAPAWISARGVAGGGWPNQRPRASSRPPLLRPNSALVSPRAGRPFSACAPCSPPRNPRNRSRSRQDARRSRPALRLASLGNREKRAARRRPRTPRPRACRRELHWRHRTPPPRLRGIKSNPGRCRPRALLRRVQEE